MYSEIDAPHQLIYLDASDDLCLKQIAKKCFEQPERAATDKPEMFAQVNKHFVAPNDVEGFVVTMLEKID